MNNSVPIRNKYLFMLILYGFIVIGSSLNFSAPYHDEALNILMGRQVLAHEPCPAAAQNTGSVLVQPIIAAIGDSLGGLLGARGAGLPFALALTVIIYLYSRTLLPPTPSLFAATVFLFSGTTLYLAKLATYDIIAAFFLGLAFLCILYAEQERHRCWAWLLAGAGMLFMASITKYVVAVYAPPLIIFALCRHDAKRALLFFTIPFLILSGAYVRYALYPVADSLLGSMFSVYQESHVDKLQLASWAFRWVAMPYLLAVFGFFHGTYGKPAIILTAISTPVIIFHLLTGAEQSVNKNVIFAMVFLAPAAAIGIDHLGNIFSFNSASDWVKPFFTLTLFIVLWAFGLNQLKWLQNQYPDLSPVIKYFQQHGKDGMTAVIDSDFGDAVYTYSLEKRLPNAVFSPISVTGQCSMSTSSVKSLPDYIILDDYYTKKPYRLRALSCISGGRYTLSSRFRIAMSWGEKNVTIYSRRTP